MSLPLQLLLGLWVGVAGLMPGVSGSAFLVLFGVYRPLTTALAQPTVNPAGNLRRFGPFFLAAAIGLLLASRLLAVVFTRHAVPTTFLFMGLMLGLLPNLIRQAGGSTRSRAAWLPFVVTLGLCAALAWYRRHLAPPDAALTPGWPLWTVIGAGIGLGSILPGLSVSFLIIYLGVYSPLLHGVAHLDLAILLPVAFGAVTTILLFARLANWLFLRAEVPTVRGILGLTTGSLWLVFPGWPEGRAKILCLALLTGGFGLSTLLNRWVAAPPLESEPPPSTPLLPENQLKPPGLDASRDKSVPSPRQPDETDR